MTSVDGAVSMEDTLPSCWEEWEKYSCSKKQSSSGSYANQIRMDREAWRAAVHGVAKNWTQLSNWTTMTRSPYYPAVLHLGVSTKEIVTQASCHVCGLFIAAAVAAGGRTTSGHPEPWVSWGHVNACCCCLKFGCCRHIARKGERSRGSPQCSYRLCKFKWVIGSSLCFERAQKNGRIYVVTFFLNRKCPKLGDLKQQKCILSHFWHLEVQIKVSAGLVSPGGSEEEAVPWLS